MVNKDGDDGGDEGSEGADSGAARKGGGGRRWQVEVRAKRFSTVGAVMCE